MIRISSFPASFVLSCLGLVILTAGSAPAQDYHPLEVGCQWYYENDLGETELMTITGEATILGEVTRIRREDLGSDLFENYWTRDENGHLFLHGFYNLAAGFGLAYQPPIRMVDAPLELGKTWVTEGVESFNLDGSPSGRDPFDYPLMVDFEGEISVPAGLFHAYGVGIDDSYPLWKGPGGYFDLFGRCLGERPRKDRTDITEWYTEGVGLTRKTPYLGEQHTFDLQWWNPPVPISEGSWGRVKAAFH